MTYRCVDCVFSEIRDKQTCEMACLKHKKTVRCMDNHCNDLILIPLMFLSHLCYHQNYDYVKKGKFDWSGADQMAEKLLDESGFAGMIAPDEIALVPKGNRECSTDIKLQATISTLIEVMAESHYELPKELYDIRFSELRHFIDVQMQYNKHFKLISKEAVEDIETKGD